MTSVILTTIIFLALILGIPVAIIWFILRLRKIRKKIPEKLKQEAEKLKGGENGEIERRDEKKEKERTNFERLGGRRGADVIKQEIRGDEETGRDSENNYGSSGRGRVPILPPEQSDKHKRKSKIDWAESN